MSNKSKVQITSIYCNSASELGNDEVYLICQADGGVPIRYPAQLADAHSMTKGDTWKLTDPDLVLNFENEVLVTLWDRDVSYDPTVSTYLVSNDYTPGGGAGSVRIQNPNGADYTIYAEPYAS